MPRRLRLRAAAAACSVLPAAGLAQHAPAQVHPVTGLTIVSTEAFPDGDRDNVVRLELVDSSGIHYVWRSLEIHGRGDTIRDVRERLVRTSDLAGAPRLDLVFAAEDDLERPGHTAWSISSAVYTALRDQGSARFTTVWVDASAGRLGALGLRRTPRRARHKGTLALVSPTPGPFPLLVDGHRVSLPALHLRTALSDGARTHALDLWVLADSAYPMLLKGIRENHVFQVTQINHPVDVTGALGPSGGGLLRGGGRMLEQQLAAACRVELPGIYFAFNSSLLDPASDQALAQVVAVLARHPDWALSLEGHTDSVGTTATNQALSERRAEAVRARLAEQHGADTRAWKAVGYGATRPREPNSTIEGRARNRRVELVRACPERR